MNNDLELKLEAVIRAENYLSSARRAAEMYAIAAMIGNPQLAEHALRQFHAFVRKAAKELEGLIP